MTFSSRLNRPAASHGEPRKTAFLNRNLAPIASVTEEGGEEEAFRPAGRSIVLTQKVIGITIYSYSSLFTSWPACRLPIGRRLWL